MSAPATSTGRRIAFAMSGDAGDPRAFSGLPASFSRALTELGVDVAPVDAKLPEPWQRLVVNAMTFGFLDPPRDVRALARGRDPRLVFRDHKPKLLPSREMTAIRSAVARSRLRRQGPVDRAITWGTEFRLPAGTDYVTLDDATIAQLRRSWPYPWMQAVSDRSLQRMIARQQRIFRGARACCTLTHWAARSAIGDYGVAPERVHVVGVGSNRRLAPVERDFEPPRFLFVGKDFERKNGPAVVRAFAEVRRRHPRATLDIVGEHPPIGEENVVEHGMLSLDDPRDVARVDDLYARATCLVVPSRFEPAGIVYAEALASGLGMIATTRGGSETIVGDGGVVVDPDDHRALTEHMDRFCDPEIAGRYAAQARSRAPLFTWRAVAERVVRALELPAFDPAALAEPL